MPPVEHLRDRRVAVVGLGALGGPAAILLAKAGVGALILKRLLDVAGGNLGLLLRHLTDVGTPRGRCMCADRVVGRSVGPSGAGLDAVSARFAVDRLATAPSDLPAIHLNTEGFYLGLLR